MGARSLQPPADLSEKVLSSAAGPEPLPGHLVHQPEPGAGAASDSLRQAWPARHIGPGRAA